MWRLMRPDAAAVLSDKHAQKSLGRYFAVMEDKKPAKFMIAKKLEAKFSENDPIAKLWKEHEYLKKEFDSLEKRIDNQQQSLQNIPRPKKSYLDLKIEVADRILSGCHLCSRRCGVNRLEGKLGYCKCGLEMAVSSIFQHMGEEPELVPSGTIFTMGCTMCCKHCQNWTISQWMESGETYTSKELAIEIERLRSEGSRNVNLVGGEPTPWLKQWLETLNHVNVNIPVVWNSNTYYSQETAKLLGGFADVYLLDFKYGPGKCAGKISEAPNYWEVCTYNHLEAAKAGELIIRILILPNHLDCCAKPTIEWIAKNLGTETRVNVMFQYRPEWRAGEVSELQRRLTREEMEKASKFAKEVGLVNFIT